MKILILGTGKKDDIYRSKCHPCLSNKEYLFEPNFKYAFAAVPKASFGFEYYGNTGKIFNPYKLPLQEHIMYLVLDLFIHPLFEFNLGIGEGLTESSNGINVKCFIGKRINWKHK